MNITVEIPDSAGAILPPLARTRRALNWKPSREGYRADRLSEASVGGLGFETRYEVDGFQRARSLSALHARSMIVIADTGPINYFVLIGEIEALPERYDRILTRPSICGELEHPRAPEAVRLLGRAATSRERRTDPIPTVEFLIRQNPTSWARATP